MKWYFRDTSYNSWPIVWRHPQQLCLWSRRGFASPQSALSSLNLYLQYIYIKETFNTDVKQQAKTSSALSHTANRTLNQRESTVNRTGLRPPRFGSRKPVNLTTILCREDLRMYTRSYRQLQSNSQSHYSSWRDHDRRNQNSTTVPLATDRSQCSEKNHVSWILVLFDPKI